MVRRIVSLAAALLTVFALCGPSTHVPWGRSYYLALGDSLAAGYQPGPGVGRTAGYVWRVAAALPGLRLRNLACDGATTTTMLTGGGGCAYRAGSQLAEAERFLRAHRGHVRLVTIDIGGNDVNACVAGGAIDEACVLSAIGTAATDVARISRRLRAAAPGARVVGMTYYDPYLAAWLRGAEGEAVARQSLRLTARFDATLAQAYAAGGVRVARVAAAFDTFDLTTRVELPGAGPVPLAVARICAWTWMCVPGRAPDIHPNNAGYAVIARAYLGMIR
jgi:lysophospholipase L1-like esterase